MRQKDLNEAIMEHEAEKLSGGPIIDGDSILHELEDDAFSIRATVPIEVIVKNVLLGNFKQASKREMCVDKDRR